MTSYDYRSLINDYVNFPKQGIIFRDISPLLSHPRAFKLAIKEMSGPFRGSSIDRVISLESRGFIIGAPIALELGVGFTPIRKAGKLPGHTLQVPYSLEYGEASLELQSNVLKPNQNVLLVDDVLATGGTLEAAIRLIKKCGAQIAGIAVILELKDLCGRDKLSGYEVTTLMQI